MKIESKSETKIQLNLEMNPREAAILRNLMSYQQHNSTWLPETKDLFTQIGDALEREIIATGKK